MNITAYTDPTAPYPGYISINEATDENVSITVRSRGGNNQAWMEIPKADLIVMANEILAKCVPVAEDAPAPKAKK